MIRRVLLALFLLAGFAAAAETVRLTEGDLELELDPRAAGRVTSFRLRGGENVLYSIEADKLSSPLPALVYDNDNFLRLYGHVMWLGPQADWWRQQETDPKAKAKAYVWPPDPYWEFAQFAVVSRTGNAIVLKSPHSPFSGVTMTKEVRLLPGGEAVLTTTIENTGGKPVKWGLWSNTRISGNAVVFALPQSKKELRFEFSTWESPQERPLAFDAGKGFVRFPGSEPQSVPKDGKLTGKLFVLPRKPVIAAFIGKTLFLKKTKALPPGKIAPGHCQVELFGEKSRDPARSFYELEFHGEYAELAPGQSLSMEETWLLRPASLKDDADALRELEPIADQP